MEIEIARTRAHASEAAWRPALVGAIGPLTMLAGIVWAVAQPYRLTLLNDARAGVWDHLAQPPLLVIAVGLFFHLVVAQPLLRTLRGRP